MSEKHETKLRRVKELVELMKENDLVELEIADGDSKISLKRPQPGAPTITQIPMAQSPAATPGPTPSVHAADVEAPAKGEQQDLTVEVGSQVNPDTVVCIVEAMKVMNEIKAETYGTIVKILCETGEAVEYGQVLFKVKGD